jgi:uncharacterized surface protein with fasciclin (FAS1) repeats
MYKHANKIILIFAGILAITYYSSCKKATLVTTTTQDVNIYGYLAKNPDQFSEFVKILDMTGYDGFLNAYGAYTLFAPTNDALSAYLKEINKTSVDQIDVEEMKNLVKLHVIQDTITTNSFKDGKLPKVTLYGQYLLTGVTNTEGTSNFIINRQATVAQSNIVTGNGIIQVITNVLKPAKLTLAKMIEQNPEFSIFNEALKATGLYDSLNIENNPDTTRRFLTVFAETNQALKDTGIISYADLKARYSQTGDPKNHADSLYLYVAYHINIDANYLADIVTASSLSTLAPLEVLSPRLDEQNVLINDLDFNGVHEKGVILDRNKSDNSATNGVLHTSTGHFAIKIRQPVPLYWDVADFPEVRRLPAVFRKSNFSFAPGSLKDIMWENTTTMQSVVYTFAGLSSTNFIMYNADYITLPIGLTNTARSKWFEFRTPLLVKGRYKVWICYRAQASSGNNPAFPLRTLFNGEPFSRLFDFQVGVPAGTVGELEALGWKRYSEPTISSSAGRLLGTIDVKTTDRHIFRIEALNGGGQSTNNLDMIHFIPIDMNQVSPRFTRDGKMVP